jgi:hypothetical protein
VVYVGTLLPQAKASTSNLRAPVATRSVGKEKGKEKERGESAEAEVKRQRMTLREERIVLKGRIRALEGMLEVVKVQEAELE